MNAAVAQERWQGQIIDDQFPLLEWLGGSANTAVFSTQLPGSPTQPAQPAAIKLVRAESTNPAVQLARWKEIATLSHSRLLRIYASGQCVITGAHWLYCVMEFAEENLDQVLPVRPLSSTEVGELLPPLVEALSFIHAKGLVHSRLRPTNVFATKHELKLSRDNLRAANQEGQKFAPLTAYDAPEVESGNVSAAADIWSLGMTLATVFNQRPLSWSRSGQIGPAIPKLIPAPYRLIAAECLRIDPTERCSLGRIRELLSQQSLQPVAVPHEQPRRKMTGPMVAVVAIAVVGLALLVRHSTEQQLSQAVPEKAQPVRTEAATPQQAVQGSSDAARTESRSSLNDSRKKHHATPASSPVLTQKPAVVQPTVLQPAVATTSGASDAIVERVLPSVPRSARETIHGKVHVAVRVSVDANGNVSSASLTSPGPSRYFARVALEASQKWKFKPLGANSKAAQWTLEYRFGRGSTEVTPLLMQ